MTNSNSNSNNNTNASFLQGFDFFKQMPSINTWGVPTLSIEDIDKKLNELKTVQFWLDQNTAGLKAAIQALEVQKMTLNTLQGLNLSMTDVAASIHKTTAQALADLEAKTSRFPIETTQSEEKSQTENQVNQEPPQPIADASATPVMQLWGNWMEQFNQLATNTMQEISKAAPQTMSTADGVTDDVGKKNNPSTSVTSVPPAATKKPRGKAVPLAKNTLAKDNKVVQNKSKASTPATAIATVIAKKPIEKVAARKKAI